jgi:hypothetical protein
LSPRESDHWHYRLPRPRHQRPRYSRPAKQRDELASFQLIELHSIAASQGRMPPGFRSGWTVKGHSVTESLNSHWFPPSLN